jgi:hypothetical protein
VYGGVCKGMVERAYLARCKGKCPHECVYFKIDPSNVFEPLIFSNVKRRTRVRANAEKMA